MSLRDVMAADVAGLLADPEGPAETVMFRPAAGPARSILAIVERLSQEEAAFTDGKSDQETAILHLTYASVPTLADEDVFGITSPATAKEDPWRIAKVRADNGAVREVLIVRSTRTRLSDELTERDRIRSADFGRTT